MIFFGLECCKDMKNFNSMFAIISGLDHKTVQRLQATWERVPEKYKKLFEVNNFVLFNYRLTFKISSRNMSNFGGILNYLKKKYGRLHGLLNSMKVNIEIRRETWVLGST
jgi:hypothetical protein